MRHQRAPGAVVDDDATVAGRANAIHSFRLDSRSGRGRTTVPTASPASAPASTPATSAAAITARTPDHDAIFAAASLLAIPPLPRSVPRPPGHGFERVVDRGDLLDQRRLLVEPRIGGEQARRCR